VPIWWDIVTNPVFPDAGALFADTDLVMVPRFTPEDDGCCLETVRRMQEAYGGELSRRFVLTDESRHWQLLSRR
jgi:hypothetical protein